MGDWHVPFCAVFAGYVQYFAVFYALLFILFSSMSLCGQGIVNRFAERFAVQRYENIWIYAIFFAYLSQK